MKVKHKIFLYKTLFVVAPILLLIGTLHLTSTKIRQSYTLSKMGSDYLLIEKTHYALYIKKEFEKEGNYYGDILQNYYLTFLKEYEKTFQLTPFPQKLTIKLFKTREEFENLVFEEQRRELPYSGGFYDPSKRTIVLYLGDPDIFKALIHEHIHAIFDFSLRQHSDPHFSRCFNEGIACFFENAFTFKKDGSVDPFDFKKIPEAHKIEILKQSIQQKTWVSLEELINASEHNFVSRQNYQYYYQSELLVYYLWNHKPDLFLQWYQLELDPRPIQGAWWRKLCDLDQFEKEWKDFILKL